MRRREEEEYYRYNQERPRFENEYNSTPHLSSRGAEFESIRLATRIHEWYRDRVPVEESTELPAQKGTLRISDTDRAVQSMYLYEPEKDDRDLHGDHMVYEPPQSSSSKQFYSQLQPGLQLEEDDWLEDYNYIRPGKSSIRDEAYQNRY